jgi:hypothetical protein
VGRLSFDEAGGGLGYAADALMSAVLLSLSFARSRSLERIVGLIGLIVLAYIYFVGQFRHGVFMCLSALILGTIYIPMRSRDIPTVKWRKWSGAIIAGLVLIGVGLVRSEGWYGSYIERTTTGFLNRVDRSEDSMTLRLDETAMALSESSDMELVFGKGAWGAWSGSVLYQGERRNMLHFGPGHLMLKGGVPLLITVIVFPFGVAWVCLLRSRNYAILACAGYITIVSMIWLICNIFTPSILSVILWLSAGRLLGLRWLPAMTPGEFEPPRFRAIR